MAMMTSPGQIRKVAWLIAGWTWALVAGGGGLMLLFEKGPLPLTNGWFALGSGISALPVLPWVARRLFGVRLSPRGQFIAAALFFVAGHVASFLEHRV